MNLNHKIKFCSYETNDNFWKDTCKNIDHTSGEDPESAEAEATNEIYLFIITGSDEIKSLQLIPS